MTEPNREPLIGPQVQYPTPWRVAEKRGNHHIIVCSEGHYTGEVPGGELASLIVAAVNAYEPTYLAQQKRGQS